MGGNLALNTGSALAIELGGTTPGTGYDQIQVAGTITLGGNLNVTIVNGFGLALNQTFTIVEGTSAAPLAGVFSNAPGTLYTDARGDTFLVNYAANTDGGALPNDVTLRVLSVVPEPSVWALTVLGVVGLCISRSRRRRVRLA